MGAGASASAGVLTTVFGAMMEVDFFGAGGCVSVEDRVMSGPCSIGSALAGFDDVMVLAVSFAGLGEGETIAGVGGCA